MMAWSKSTVRREVGLQQQKEPLREDETHSVTFAPNLVSDPALREKSRSSGYGKFPTTKKQTVLDEKEFRPWEQVPSFKPDINKSPNGTSSSKYGLHTPPPAKILPPREDVSFKPEFPNSNLYKKIQSQAKSSDYGKVVPEGRKLASPTPQDQGCTFSPSITKTKKTESVNSTGYGKKLVEGPPRPASAPSDGGFRLDCVSYSNTGNNPHVSTTVVLKDRGTPSQVDKNAQKPRDFLLDGVKTSNSTNMRFVSPPSVKSSNSMKVFEHVNSSGYGKKLPETRQTPPPADQSPPESKSRPKSATPPHATKLPKKAPSPVITNLLEKNETPSMSKEERVEEWAQEQNIERHIQEAQEEPEIHDDNESEVIIDEY